jgi:hypothetical protein
MKTKTNVKAGPAINDTAGYDTGTLNSWSVPVISSKASSKAS